MESTRETEGHRQMYRVRQRKQEMGGTDGQAGRWADRQPHTWRHKGRPGERHKDIKQAKGSREMTFCKI